MSAIYILILASLLVAFGFLMAFLWAVKSGQYEDNYTPSIRIILDPTNDFIEGKSKNDNGER